MKFTISLLLLFCLFTGKELLAQEVDITGSWTMFEMIWTSGDEVNTTTEEQLKDQGMHSDYSFMPDGKLELISNMTGSGRLETHKGTWKLEGGKLTCGFIMEENPVNIVWDFEFKEGFMHLMRSAPDGSSSVVNSFKRK